MNVDELHLLLYQKVREAVENFGVENLIDLLVREADDDTIVAWTGKIFFVEWTMKFKTLKEENDHGKQSKCGEIDGEEGEGHRKSDGQKRAFNRILELLKQCSTDMDDDGEPPGDRGERSA